MNAGVRNLSWMDCSPNSSYSSRTEVAEPKIYLAWRVCFAGLSMRSIFRTATEHLVSCCCISPNKSLEAMRPPKKRRRLSPVATEEITFDNAARHEYLTGFHKRKVQRTNAAKEAAERRAKEEKKEERSRLRQERQAELDRHVKEVNAYFEREPSGSEIGGEGDEANPSESDDEAAEAIEPLDHEAEYIDEDKYTSVTVEEMDVTREGLRKAQDDDEGNEPDHNDGPQTTQMAKGNPAKRTWTKDKPKDGISKPKKKRKKFRYEGKAERKVNRDKEKSKNRQQARLRRAR